MIFLPSSHKARVAWCFGDDFDVDQLIGVANIKVQDEAALTNQVMKQFEDDFLEKMGPGDILVGGRNFGYGHPHAISMRAMRHIGIKAVIAESFFSSFWIGEIGYGMPLLVCPGITAHAKRFDPVVIDFDSYTVSFPETGLTLHCEPYTKREKAILRAGGLKNFLLNERNSKIE
ncbi:MAG TPA: 3-isopropylmalate dehydratase [Burkholderiaceae bacterium]|nr:3-isopropylmalate dehydratase [Burkholderiaceae bacterium]